VSLDDSIEDSRLDAVVVGAGQAGLAMGYHLKQQGRRFLVLERGRVAETWRTQRWDSFVINTPRWMSTLPGAPYQGEAEDGFFTKEEWIAYLEAYSSRFDIPVRAGFEVTAVRPAPGRAGFVIEGLEQGVSSRPLEAKAVVVASGILNAPKIPDISEDFPTGITQIHAAGYRSAEALPEGAVLLIGAAQSGCQIAEDLLQASRSVYMCTSRVGRIPRRHRGRDVMDWLLDMGFWDVAVEDLDDPAMTRAPQPQISGVGRFGHTVSLQQLARDGAVLMGHLTRVENGVLHTDDRLAEHIGFADEFSADVKAEIDDHIAAGGLDAPPSEVDAADLPQTGIPPGSLETLDLVEAGVGTVIWCTGFSADFGWLQLAVLDETGSPLHVQGVSPVPGVYFLGFPWLRTRKSGVILGIEEDAGHIASELNAFLG
jgi:putative flavoprotein involved in K+ transport